MPICFNVSVYHMDLKRKIAEDTILDAPLNTSQDNIPKSSNSGFNASVVVVMAGHFLAMINNDKDTELTEASKSNIDISVSV